MARAQIVLWSAQRMSAPAIPFNSRRLHSTLDYNTPIEIEDLYYRRGDGIAA